jgi:hypothetical protein
VRASSRIGEQDARAPISEEMTMYDPEYTHNEQIMAYQLPEFFEELDKKFTGKSVSMERDGDLVYKGEVTDWATLQSVKFYHKVRKGDALFIETKHNGEQSKYSFKSPVIVWVVRDQNRRILAVQAIDEEGRNIILRFKP